MQIPATDQVTVEPVSQEQVRPHPVTPHSEQNSPASGIQGPPISQVASTHPNIASAPQIDSSNLPLAADTGKQSSTALSPPDRTLGGRRERLDGARTTFETIEAVSGTIPVVGSFVGAGAKVGLAVVKMIQVRRPCASFAGFPPDAGRPPRQWIVIRKRARILRVVLHGYPTF